MGYGASSGSSALGWMAARQGSKESLTSSSLSSRSSRKGSKESQGSNEKPQKEPHCLSKQQMRDLLISVAPTKEDTPTEEEVAFMLHIYGGGQHLLKAWNRILQDRKVVAAKMHQFDQCNTGRLGRKELKDFLVHLNNGNDVQDKDVDEVLSVADVSGDGAIWPVELELAADTYRELQRKRQKKGSTMMFSLLTHGRNQLHFLFGVKSEKKSLLSSTGRKVSGGR